MQESSRGSSGCRSRGDGGAAVVGVAAVVVRCGARSVRRSRVVVLRFRVTPFPLTPHPLLCKVLKVSWGWVVINVRWSAVCAGGWISEFPVLVCFGEWGWG